MQTNKISIPSDVTESSLESFNNSIDLFTFFVSKEENEIIKSWSEQFNKNPLMAFCDLLSIILQIAGKKIDVTPVHIEGDLFDQVLEEFQDAMNSDAKYDASLIERLMKDKNNIK